MFASDYERRYQARSQLEKLKQEQDQFRKENMHDSGAVLAREQADRAESIRLLHLGAQSNKINELRDYYRAWYSKDSTAENVVATVIYKYLVESDQTFHSFFASSFYIDNSFKLHFGTMLLEELKRIILASEKNFESISSIDDAIAAPVGELIKEYKNEIFEASQVDANSSCVKDVMSMLTYQFDDDRVFAQLDVIEARLKVDARAKGMLDDASNTLKGYKEGQAFKHNKLLFGCLEQLVVECDYAGFANVYTQLISEDFISLLKGGTPFKDAGVRGPTHGEEGHLLQLICLGLEYKKLREKFLTKHPAKVFAEIDSEPKKDRLSLFWSVNFELAYPIRARSKDVIPSSIGRSVFKLHSYLTHPKSCSRYPVLHQLVKSRDFKPALSEAKIQKIGTPFKIKLFTPQSSTDQSAIPSTVTCGAKP